MLEIIALIALTGYIGRTVEAKGHKSGMYKWMTVGLWFGGEIVGLILGVLITGGSPDGQCLMYIIALLGAAAGAITATVIANNVQPAPGFPKTPVVASPPESPQKLP